MARPGFRSVSRMSVAQFGRSVSAAMCQHQNVNARQFTRLLGVGLATICAALLSAPLIIASASAAACPDAEVTFARGTAEPPGVGGVGQAFIDSLRSQLGGRSLGVYAVNYPATEDWPPSASAGATDASTHVESMAASCPNTKLVLGGYSQGAMVIDLITIARAPVAGFIPQTLSAEVADHVAAVAVFGNPTDRYLGGPISEIALGMAIRRLTCVRPTIRFAPPAPLRCLLTMRCSPRHTCRMRSPGCPVRQRLSW